MAQVLPPAGGSTVRQHRKVDWWAPTRPIPDPGWLYLGTWSFSGQPAATLPGRPGGMTFRVMLAAMCCPKGDLDGNLAAHDRRPGTLTVDPPLPTGQDGAA